MKNSNKKGFTIVELVIVIAVIAILAAVLIPTFSGLVKKANLSADKQAVREMNQVLAEWEASRGYPDRKTISVNDAMQAIADAGYNSKNWACLTENYQVFWDKEKNQCVLYNTDTSEVEYPEEYSADVMTNANTVNMKLSDGTIVQRFYPYNGDFQQAMNQDFELANGKAGMTTPNTAFSSSMAGATTMQSKIGSSLAENAESSLKSALGFAKNDKIYINACRSETSVSSSIINAAGNKTAYANLEIMSVSKDPTLKSTDKINANLYTISIVKPTDVTSTSIAQAERAAGEYLYSLFAQMSAGAVSSNASIVIEAGTTLNVSGKEWIPVKEFCGYFGTSDTNSGFEAGKHLDKQASSYAPVVIDGAQLSVSTGYSRTLSFEGSGSKYFITGFFGCVYGKATIENLTFRNMSINRPGNDWFKNNPGVQSRNCVAVIGGILNGTTTANATKMEVNVRNINVENTVNITGAATVGGLVGVVGRFVGDVKSGSYAKLDNCLVSANVSTTALADQGTSYSPAGGLVAEFYTNGINLTIKDCTFNGSVDGYESVAAAVGDYMGRTSLIFEGENDFAKAKVNNNGTGNIVAGVVTNTQSSGHGNIIISNGASITYAGEIAFAGLTETKAPREIARFKLENGKFVQIDKIKPPMDK